MESFYCFYLSRHGMDEQRDTVLDCTMNGTAKKGRGGGAMTDLHTWVLFFITMGSVREEKGVTLTRFIRRH